MSTSNSEVIKKLALDKARKAIRKKLADPECTPHQKLAVLAANQEDRLYVLKWTQYFTLENEFKKKLDFYTNKYHYDWWAFPMFVPAEWKWPDRNYHASVSPEEAIILLRDGEFVATYLSCIELYLQALQNNKWNDYPVRYARMLHSLSLFLQAANTMEDPKIKKKLIGAATAGMNYATKQHFAEHYKEYDLFMDGLKKVSLLIASEEPKHSPPAAPTM